MNFDKAFEYTLKNEGGWSNHPNDSGGATNLGITRGVYSRWLGREVSEEELKNISKDTVKEIYKAWYWDVNRLDEVKSFPISCAIFDIGVVCGVRTSATMAQTNLRVNLGDKYVHSDGIIGPVSLRSLNAADEKAFIRGFKKLADERFMNIANRMPKNQVFLRGWLNRSKRLLTLIGE
jgi:lysozyme family protein